MLRYYPGQFWRDFIGYFMSRGQNSHYSRYLSSCSRGKETRSDVIITRVSSFPFSYFTWKETKLVLLSLAIVSLRSWSQMLFRKVQKRQQNGYGSKGYKINQPLSLSGLLLCRLIMFLAERLPSRFFICPRSFASRPNIFSARGPAARRGIFTNDHLLWLIATTLLAWKLNWSSTAPVSQRS